WHIESRRFPVRLFRKHTDATPSLNAHHAPCPRHDMRIVPSRAPLRTIGSDRLDSKAQAAGQPICSEGALLRDLSPCYLPLCRHKQATLMPAEGSSELRAG